MFDTDFSSAVMCGGKTPTGNPVGSLLSNIGQVHLPRGPCLLLEHSQWDICRNIWTKPPISPAKIRSGPESMTGVIWYPAAREAGSGLWKREGGDIRLFLIWSWPTAGRYCIPLWASWSDFFTFCHIYKNKLRCMLMLSETLFVLELDGV